MSSWSEASGVRAREHTASAEEVEGASGRGTRPEPRVSKPEASGVRACEHTASAEEGSREMPVLVRLATPELRTGVWTRFGDSNVLGDAVTEETLSTLAESTRTAARSQGYAVGWAEGQRAAREQARIEAEEAALVRREAE